MIILGLIRIVFGAVWVGTAFFIVLFFEVTIRAAGPAGGMVMARLSLTNSPMGMGLSSIAFVAAGLLMYLDDSGGFQVNWISTPAGIALTLGTMASVLAFVVGLAVQTPCATRMSALQKEIQATVGSPTPSQLLELNHLQQGIINASRWGAVLLMVSVLGMAIAWELERF